MSGRPGSTRPFLIGTVSSILMMIALSTLFLGDRKIVAQVLYGSLTGIVTDSSGAAVVGAQVTALAVETGVTQTEVSDSSGIYRFTTLLPGTYRVTITAQGFSNQETPGVLVRVNEIARVNAELKVGSATQSIMVTTEAPLLQTDKADVHTDITEQQVENLPISGTEGRNFQSLLRTIPGAGLSGLHHYLYVHAARGRIQHWLTAGYGYQEWKVAYFDVRHLHPSGDGKWSISRINPHGDCLFQFR